MQTWVCWYPPCYSKKCLQTCAARLGGTPTSELVKIWVNVPTKLFVDWSVQLACFHSLNRSTYLANSTILGRYSLCNFWQSKLFRCTNTLSIHKGLCVGEFSSWFFFLYWRKAVAYIPWIGERKITGVGGGVRCTGVLKKLSLPRNVWRISVNDYKMYRIIVLLKDLWPHAQLLLDA